MYLLLSLAAHIVHFEFHTHSSLVCSHPSPPPCVTPLEGSQPLQVVVVGSGKHGGQRVYLYQIATTHAPSLPKV
jgi:hypothetical protein